MALLAHARSVPADRRAALAASWHDLSLPGTVVVATCHRAELYGTEAALAAAQTADDKGIVVARGSAVARHLISLAVGRDSAVLGEDQILHQLRTAVSSARRHHRVAHELDRAFDLALRAGRIARSWLPASRPTLVDLALEHVTREPLAGRQVHVVGSGEMGRRALALLVRVGADVSLSSRSRDTARAATARVGGTDLEFDPGPERLRQVDGIVVAIAGRWSLGPDSQRAISEGSTWVVDLSAPPALDPALAQSIGRRFVSIDDLDRLEDSAASAGTIQKMDALVADHVRAYEEWATDEEQRSAAEALARRAEELRSDELARLWRRVPGLDETERAEVARAVEHLTQQLLRDPFEELGRDRDGSRTRAARELFRL